MAKSVEVVGAVIVRDGLVLSAQRGAAGALAGMWEFPGGKVEHGESAREALAREIREELLCDVDVGEFITTTTHQYPFAEVTLHSFWCVLDAGEPTATEHADLQWLGVGELRTVDWAPADIPAVELVERALSAGRS